MEEGREFNFRRDEPTQKKLSSKFPMSKVEILRNYGDLSPLANAYLQAILNEYEDHEFTIQEFQPKEVTTRLGMSSKTNAILELYEYGYLNRIPGQPERFSLTQKYSEWKLFSTQTF